MFFEQDWIMRQIQIIVQVLARAVFHKDSIRYEITDEKNLSETDLLYKKITDLIKQHKICEAENILFDNLDENDANYLEMSLDFYQTLNKITDGELEKYNFSRQEINDGINDILTRFHIVNLFRDNITKTCNLNYKSNSFNL